MSEVADKIAVMQAFAEGKAVEVKHHALTDDCYIPDKEPVWDWRELRYRIAPHPPEPRAAREFAAILHVNGEQIWNETHGFMNMGQHVVLVEKLVPEVLPEPAQVEPYYNREATAAIKAEHAPAASDRYSLAYRCRSEIENLQRKLAAGEQEGWEGSARRTVLKRDLDIQIARETTADGTPLEANPQP